MQVGVDHPLPGKPTATPSDRIAPQCLVFLQEVLGSVHPRDFTFRLWDGSVWNAEPGELSRFTMVLRNPGVLRTMFWSPSELALGEAYLYNDLDIEGDISSAFLLADRLVHLRLGLTERLRFARLLLALPSSGRSSGARPAERLRGPLHSIGRDRQAVTYHYDLSNAFYSCGWTSGWCTPARISRIPAIIWTRPRNGNWIIYVGSCGCSAAIACSTSDVDGGDWSSTRRRTTASRRTGSPGVDPSGSGKRTDPQGWAFRPMPGRCP